jgi:hypothetical protein
MSIVEGPTFQVELMKTYFVIMLFFLEDELKLHIHSCWLFQLSENKKYFSWYQGQMLFKYYISHVAFMCLLIISFSYIYIYILELNTDIETKYDS